MRLFNAGAALLIATSLEATAQRTEIGIEVLLPKLLDGRQIASIGEGASSVELTIRGSAPERQAPSDIRIVCVRTGPGREQIMIQDHVLLTDDRKTVDAGFCDSLLTAARQLFNGQGR